MVERLECQTCIWRPSVQVPPWPLAGLVLGYPKFEFSTTFVNSQLVRPWPVRILNPSTFDLSYLF